MAEMVVRQANIEDLDRAMEIFDLARDYMRRSGNDAQWINGYPSRELISQDIENGDFYVWEESNGTIHGVFSFIIGDDPTYQLIEDGEWLNDELYGTIHRMASDGTKSGMLDECTDYCLKFVKNVRADTHKINSAMQEALRRKGYKYCGVIYCQDGTARDAFQISID